MKSSVRHWRKSWLEIILTPNVILIFFYYAAPRYYVRIDAAYCYRPIYTDRVVWLSVGLSIGLSRQWALRNGWTNGDAVWVEDFRRPKGPYIRWGLKSPWERATLRGKGPAEAVVWITIGLLCSELHVQKRLNRSRCRLGFGGGRTQGSKN